MSEPRRGPPQHWLLRPATIRWLWRIGFLLLALTVLAQIWIRVYSHFGVDGWFGFHAVYGLLVCVAMVLLAKLLGVLLKRPDTYYDNDD